MQKTALILAILIGMFFPSSSLALSGSSSATLPKQEARNRLMQQKEALTEKKDAIKVTREQNKEALKERLATFKDKKKQQIAMRLDTKVTEKNTHRTTQMTEALTRLSTLTDSIATKTATEKLQGKDTSAVEVAITDARQAILIAKAAVATQAAKDYTLETTGETTVKSDAKKFITTMMQDIKATHETVKSARLAVITAARSLSQLRQQSAVPEASNSAAL